MFNGKALLIIGIALSLWGRSLTHDDRAAVGLKKAGNIALRTGTGAISLSASEGQMALGEKFAWEYKAKELDEASKKKSDHSGFHVSFKKGMDWQIRMPIFVIGGLACAMMFFQAKSARD
jgi:hypothetical protein